MDLFDTSNGATHLGSNNDWRNPASNETEVLSTPYPPSENSEAARKFTLNPGAYTAFVKPNGGSQTGVGLVELYDLGTGPQSSRLINISTRGLTGPGANVMIGGFVIEGGFKEVLITGKGPSLPSSITNRIADPYIILFKGVRFKVIGK